MNTPANEKCEACSAWEQETGYGKVCTHTPANEEPIKDLPDFLNRLMETPTPTHEWRGEVTLAPEGTLLAIFQQERTDAISEMFDNEDEDGLFETSKFFARLDKCVENLLNQHSAHLVERISDMAIVDDYSEERKIGFQIAKDQAIDIVKITK